jgi:hypothetical protein
VSKRALTAIGLFAVKDKAGWQRAAEFAQASKCARFTSIAAHFELALTSDSNLDLVAFFEVERVNHCRRQAHR